MPHRRAGASYEPVSVQRLDAPVLDAFYRLIQLLDEPAFPEPMDDLCLDISHLDERTGANAIVLFAIMRLLFCGAVLGPVVSENVAGG